MKIRCKTFAMLRINKKLSNAFLVFYLYCCAVNHCWIVKLSFYLCFIGIIFFIFRVETYFSPTFYLFLRV